MPVTFVLYTPSTNWTSMRMIHIWLSRPIIRILCAMSLTTSRHKHLPIISSWMWLNLRKRSRTKTDAPPALNGIERVDSIMIAVPGPSLAHPGTLPLAARMLGSGNCRTRDSSTPLSPESVARPRRQFDSGGFLCLFQLSVEDVDSCIYIFIKTILKHYIQTPAGRIYCCVVSQIHCHISPAVPKRFQRLNESSGSHAPSYVASNPARPDRCVRRCCFPHSPCVWMPVWTWLLCT